MNIAVYATDHGLGHIARQLGWIERIYRHKGLSIFFINESGKKLISTELENKINFLHRKIDIGLISENKIFAPDIDATYRALEEYMDTIPVLLKAEKDFLTQSDIDLVISDISPIPFQAALDCGLPSLALSSFTWKWVYDDLIKGHPIIDIYEKMYQMASEAYVLPLGEDMRIFRKRTEIPLIAKVSDNNFSIKIRNPGNRKKVFFSMGYSIFPNIKHLTNENDLFTIMPEHLCSANECDVRIPATCKDLSRYVASSDFAVVKTGYSSVAECIALKKPIIGIRRTLINEDRIIGKWIERLGVGEVIDFDQLSVEYIRSFDFEKYKSAYEKLPKRLLNIGHKEVYKWIIENK